MEDNRQRLQHIQPENPHDLWVGNDTSYGVIEKHHAGINHAIDEINRGLEHIEADICLNDEAAGNALASSETALEAAAKAEASAEKADEVIDAAQEAADAANEQAEKAKEALGKIEAYDNLTWSTPYGGEAYGVDPYFSKAVRTIPQTLGKKEQEQARQNIGVADEKRVIYLEEKMAMLDAAGITVIGNPLDLTTDAKDYIVNAINEVDAHTDQNTENIGDMSTLITDAQDSLVNAINEIKQDVKDKVGDLDTLTTTAKDCAVNAINELDADLGNIPDLAFTPDTPNAVSALNKLYERIGAIENLVPNIGTIAGNLDVAKILQAIITFTGNVGTEWTSNQYAALYANATVWLTSLEERLQEIADCLYEDEDIDFNGFTNW